MNSPSNCWRCTATLTSAWRWVPYSVRGGCRSCAPVSNRRNRTAASIPVWRRSSMNRAGDRSARAGAAPEIRIARDSPAEFEAIDFSRIDLAEFIAEIMATLPRAHAQRWGRRCRALSSNASGAITNSHESTSDRNDGSAVRPGDGGRGEALATDLKQPLIAAIDSPEGASGRGSERADGGVLPKPDTLLGADTSAGQDAEEVCQVGCARLQATLIQEAVPTREGKRISLCRSL